MGPTGPERIPAERGAGVSDAGRSPAPARRRLELGRLEAGLIASLIGDIDRPISADQWRSFFRSSYSIDNSIKTETIIRAAADGAGDDVAAGLIDGRVQAHEKHAWMLRAGLGRG